MEVRAERRAGPEGAERQFQQKKHSHQRGMAGAPCGGIKGTQLPWLTLSWNTGAAGSARECCDWGTRNKLADLTSCQLIADLLQP